MISNPMLKRSMVPNCQLQGRVDIAPLLVTPNMQIRVITPPINHPRVGVEIEDD